ncbi:MAG: alpha/beta hydrolase [Proteobacteria bacterium]|nr:alpha/beta hydrolase [Pseudomonadota bacterium]
MPLAPEYQAMLDELAATPGPALSELPAADARALYQMMRPVNPDIEVGSIRQATAAGPMGDIPLRIYTPKGAGPFPVFVNFHGGGWVIGDLETADAACRDLCNTAGCVVVSVDYRLAPEHLYPAAVDDAYAATCWAHSNAAVLKSNGKLAVGGESAGGNLAAIVAQKARDENGPVIDFQLLLYPVVDSDLSRASYSENGDGYILTTETMRWFWDTYCPDASRRKEPAASPMLGKLNNLPPTLVVTAEFDPLRDEGLAYAKALTKAGNVAEGVCYDGLVHDFFGTAQIFQSSRHAFEQVCSKLREALS